MEIYLVGGAVRDQLLTLPVKERDWVVVGATPQEMLERGFRAVGKDFPVFLHPQTQEEYALARTERKVGKGYKGFVFHTSKNVTLEEDLQRRDLTINAMAKTKDGKIIDPYGGQQDLKNKILRHVSPAFAEDPVRILRLARFAAKFHDFSIHPDTLILMKKIVEAGEVDALVAERVWQELKKALQEAWPQRFFEVLSTCHALEILFPELAKQDDHFAALKRAALKNTPTTIRFAAWLYPQTKNVIERLCQRYRVPREYHDLAVLVACYHHDYQQSLTLQAEALLKLIERTDAFRRFERWQQFLVTCSFIYENSQALYHRLLFVQEAAQKVNAASLIKAGMSGEAIAKLLQEMRIQAIADALERSQTQ